MPSTPNRRQALQWLGASAADLALPSAFAQAFPNKPVRVLVGAAPGGPADFMVGMKTLHATECMRQG